MVTNTKTPEIIELDLSPAPGKHPFERELTDVSHIWACLLMLLPVAPAHMADEVLRTIDDCDDLRTRLEAKGKAA